MTTTFIRAADPHPRKTIKIFDIEMSYVDLGEGDPIIFLHGNPSSSYLWRNVIPHVAGLGRILAPDLVGMGRSGKSPRGAYRYPDQILYLDAWLEALGLTKNVTFVLHDWGGALGFNRTARFPEQVKAIAFMESIVMMRSWSDFPPPAAEMFRALRSPKGEEMILDNNLFVEKNIPAMVMRPLGDEEMAAYRAPFATRKDRWPTLLLARDNPIEGEPADVASIVERYGTWLVHSSNLPKLFINAEPGVIVSGRVRDFVRSWPNQREVTVKGRHFIQEDAPDEIGTAIATFLRELRHTK